MKLGKTTTLENEIRFNQTKEVSRPKTEEESHSSDALVQSQMRKTLYFLKKKKNVRLGTPVQAYNLSTRKAETGRLSLSSRLAWAKLWDCFKTQKNKQTLGIEMTCWFRALAENSGLIPSTCIISQPSLTATSKDKMPSLNFCQHQAHTW